MNGASPRRPWSPESPPSRGSLDLDRTMPTINTDTENEEELIDADKKNPLNSSSLPSYSEPEDDQEETEAEAEEDPIVPYLPHKHKSLAGIAARSFALGITLTTGLIGTLGILLATTSPLWRLPFFLGALSLFHFLEFWTTAAYNTRAAEIASFLLTSNWPAYAIAHTVAALECLFVHALWPGASWTPLGPRLGTVVVAVGLVLVAVGQAVRSVAMIHAGRSFNHLVQNRRREDHVLVTTGVYGVLRHPSYFGFFWWALGTQMVMGNVFSFVGYAAVLWRFFSRRIRHEEAYLVAFFGGEYVDYRRRVRTRIPFVP
ncbi:hypothetical protein CHGG_05744 [Chaetomium globosum CBS 148.51]|uniref:Protein-S-isoprenylcysteine O-methyltransferase n=1 Tax=Chaetomium globosum (strain ATCC 6205 / CBS 148.51 / DSM 1962 / NBRC 6347 / NRRL 1970) TaxID=306901 RepID=Q2H6H1_CHAGB|nr:uncharacterized protein CHGG_05744 [Chaetomium globosum CBS 148.51]EAQ89125.1 hypothetical protein CHGG_05744 [Chaetomium globosum CBS 148.51]